MWSNLYAVFITSLVYGIFFLYIIEAEDHKVAQSAHEFVQQRQNRW